MRSSVLLTVPGAQVGAPGSLDALVPAHYGDPLREQRRLAAGEAVTALPADVVVVDGPDRLSWLTTLSSQVLTTLTPGDGGAEALVLDAQGHVSHALAVVDDGAAAYLVVEAGTGPELARFLESMRFMLRVEVGVREDVAVLGSHGRGVERLARAAAAVTGTALVWRDRWPGVTEGGTSYDVGLGSDERPFRHPGTGYEAGYVLLACGREREVVEAFAAGDGAPAENPEHAATAVRGALAGMLAWEALRVEAGRPRAAREVDERVIPHELDWLRTAVHLSKGCYPGQETIARTLNLGRPPRRLTVLQLDGLSGSLPGPGARVRMGERVVGTVTSVARHHELGPVALALVRRAVPLGEPLTVAVTEPDEGGGEPVETGRVDAVQEPLVGPEGRAQASPQQRPGQDLRASLLRGGRGQAR